MHTDTLTTYSIKSYKHEAWRKWKKEDRELYMRVCMKEIEKKKKRKQRVKVRVSDKGCHSPLCVLESNWTNLQANIDLKTLHYLVDPTKNYIVTSKFSVTYSFQRYIMHTKQAITITKDEKEKKNWKIKPINTQKWFHNSINCILPLITQKERKKETQNNLNKSTTINNVNLFIIVVKTAFFLKKNSNWHTCNCILFFKSSVIYRE